MYKIYLKNLNSEGKPSKRVYFFSIFFIYYNLVSRNELL